MIRLILLAVVMLVTLAARNPALATERLVDKTELSLAGYWSSYHGDGSMIDISASVGRFFTPNLQWRLDLRYGSLHSNYSYSSSSKMWSIGPGIVFNAKLPRMARIVPYAGATLFLIRLRYFDPWNGTHGEYDNGSEVFCGARFFANGDYNTANHAFTLEFKHGGEFRDGDNRLLVGITNFF